MAQADFYILPAADEESRYRFLGKLATRAIGAGHQLYVLTDSRQQAEIISERLWHAGPETFLPSHLANTPTASQAPICLGWDTTHVPQKPDLLVNLSSHYPTQTKQFKRITEIVIQQDNILEQTRQRYKSYQQDGIKPNMHDMRNRS
jgi:DNA polymerase-3 subunit chi